MIESGKVCRFTLEFRVPPGIDDGRMLLQVNNGVTVLASLLPICINAIGEIVDQRPKSALV